jgi:hypothetical protein
MEFVKPGNKTRKGTGQMLEELRMARIWKRRSAVQTTLGAALFALVGAVGQATPAPALSLAPTSTVGASVETAKTAVGGSAKTASTSLEGAAPLRAATTSPTVSLQSRPLSVQGPGIATTGSSATVTPPAVTIEPSAVPSGAASPASTTVAVTPPAVTVRSGQAGPTVSRLAPTGKAPDPAVQTPKAPTGKAPSAGKPASHGPSAPVGPRSPSRHQDLRAARAAGYDRRTRPAWQAGDARPLPSASRSQASLTAGASAAARARTGTASLPPEVAGAGGAARTGSAPATVAPSNKPLLDVGLPVADLPLLLIPLVGIGLLILTVLAGAGRGPFERYHGPGLAVWLEHPHQLLRSLRWRHLTRRD